MQIGQQMDILLAQRVGSQLEARITCHLVRPSGATKPKVLAFEPQARPTTHVLYDGQAHTGTQE